MMKKDRWVLGTAAGETGGDRGMLKKDRWVLGTAAGEREETEG